MWTCQVGGEDHWTSQVSGECNGQKIVDLSWGFSANQTVTPAVGLNGTYTGYVFTDRSVQIIQEHDATTPIFMCTSHLVSRLACPCSARLYCLLVPIDGAI
jgi:hypothetical protein